MNLLCFILIVAPARHEPQSKVQLEPKIIICSFHKIANSARDEIRRSHRFGCRTVCDLGRKNWVEHRDDNARAIQIGNEITQHSPDLTVVTTFWFGEPRRAHVSILTLRLGDSTCARLPHSIFGRIHSMSGLSGQ